jgi:HK97 family phage major capsid protein
MANAIPLLEGTDASGGYLVRDTYGQTLQNTIQRLSPTMSLANVDRVPGKRQIYTVYAGRPTAAFVNEGAAKPVTGAEFTTMQVNVKKIATNVLYTEELLEDAVQDPTVLVSADVQGAFADLIDAHMLGYQAGTQISTSFDGMLRSTTTTVEYVQANQDAVPAAVSAAMALIEANGGTPNGVVLNPDAKAVLRAARDTTGRPLLTDGFTLQPDSFYGLGLRYSTNLPALAGTAGAGRVVGIVGDFTHALAVMRKDISVRMTDTATVDVSGTLHHLWQQNKVAFQWEQRLGFNVHDINRMFVAIINAT